MIIGSQLLYLRLLNMPLKNSNTNTAQAASSTCNDLSYLCNGSSSSMTHQRRTRKVRFSEYSELCVFRSGTKRPSDKAFTRRQLGIFKTNAAIDGLRIRQFFSQQLEQHSSTNEALRDIINRGLLTRGHVIGLEHIVSQEAACRRTHERKAHTAGVLHAQKLLSQAKYNRGDTNAKLAKFARMSSARSVEDARLRAIGSDVVVPCKKIVDSVATIHPATVATRRNTVTSRRRSSHVAQAA